MTANTQIPPPPPVSRALIAAVIGMGVMIVVGTCVLIGVVIHRMSAPSARVSTNAIATDQTLPVGMGEHIVTVTARPDGSLAIVLNGTGVERIVIWDPRSAQTIGTLNLQPQR